MESLAVKRVSVGSIYVLIWLGTFFFFVPVGTVYGVLALFGARLLHWNGEVVVGWMGFVLGPFTGLTMACIATVLVGTACSLGLWLFSTFGSINLKVVRARSTQAHESKQEH